MHESLLCAKHHLHTLPIEIVKFTFLITQFPLHSGIVFTLQLSGHSLTEQALREQNALFPTS